MAKLENWHTFGGGTGAAEGHNSHVHYTDHGEYHVQPVTNNRGRHQGYRVHFANTRGTIHPHLKHGGLWYDLGTTHTANQGKKLVQSHHDALSESSQHSEQEPTVEPGHVSVERAREIVKGSPGLKRS